MERRALAYEGAGGEFDGGHIPCRAHTHTLNGQPGHTDVGPGWLRLGACNARSSLGVLNRFTVASFALGKLTEDRNQERS